MRAYDPVYTGLLNIGNPAYYNQTTKQKMISMECVSSRIVWA